jgi:hypothetical protein
MRIPRRRSARVCRFAGIERLESRCLMAGNITAAMDGDNLVITGDELDNTLWVQSVEDQTVVLRGLAPDDRRAGTTINNIDTSFNDVRFPNVTGSIFIDLRGGSDRLFVTIGRFEGLFSIVMGLGDDRAEVGGLQPVSFGGELVVALGAGNDEYIQTNTRVDSSQRLDGGLANDRINIGSSTITEGLLVDGATGFDAIRVERTSVGAFTGILGGDQADRIEAIFSAFTQGVSILGGAGGDLVDLSGCRFDTTLFVALEADFGLATVQGCIIASNTWLTATGPANIRFANSTADRLEIATGPSHDTVVVDRSALDMLFVMLGEGNDQLRVTGNQVARGGLFDGQGGFDSLFERVITNGVQRLGFEVVDIA